MKSFNTLVEEALELLFCIRGRYWELGLKEPIWLWFTIRQFVKFLMENSEDLCE